MKSFLYFILFILIVTIMTMTSCTRSNDDASAVLVHLPNHNNSKIIANISYANRKLLSVGDTISVTKFSDTQWHFDNDVPYEGIDAVTGFQSAIAVIDKLDTIK